MFVCICRFHLRTVICKFRFPNCSICPTITYLLEQKGGRGNFAINVYYLTKQRLHFQVALKIRLLDSMT